MLRSANCLKTPTLIDLFCFDTTRLFIFKGMANANGKTHPLSSREVSKTPVEGHPTLHSPTHLCPRPATQMISQGLC